MGFFDEMLTFLGSTLTAFCSAGAAATVGCLPMLRLAMDAYDTVAGSADVDTAVGGKNISFSLKASILNVSFSVICFFFIGIFKYISSQGIEKR